MDIKGGYECDFVEKSPESTQSESPICLLVPREPYKVNCCRHTFIKCVLRRFKGAASLVPTAMSIQCTCKTDKLHTMLSMEFKPKMHYSRLTEELTGCNNIICISIP